MATSLKGFWTLPGTLVGLALAVCLGWVKSRSDGRVRVVWVRRLIPSFAAGQTWGRVILIRERPSRSLVSLARLLNHEFVHVSQWERWGPIFLLAYPLSSLWALVRGRKAYEDNAFEIAARAQSE